MEIYHILRQESLGEWCTQGQTLTKGWRGHLYSLHCSDSIIPVLHEKTLLRKDSSAFSVLWLREEKCGNERHLSPTAQHAFPLCLHIQTHSKLLFYSSCPVHEVKLRFICRMVSVTSSKA